MKLVLTVEIEVLDSNKKADVYDRLLTNDRVIDFIELQCGCVNVTDVTLQDKEEVWQWLVVPVITKVWERVKRAKNQATN